MSHARKINPDLFAAELALTNDAVILDVRTPAEFQQGSLSETAVNLDFLQDSFGKELEYLDPFRPYFVYCDTGKRGRMACEMMAEHGFLDLRFLEGGMNAWDTVFGAQEV
jgi:rhodanese-related sulfurtransferase